MGPALHPPDSPSARGEATVRRLEAAQPLSGTPGAIRMRHLHQVQRTRRDGIQEELLRAERAHLREAREYRQQVLAEFRRSRRDQALFLEEPMPAPVLAPGPPDQPTFPPPGTGPSWEHFAWLVAQVVPQQPPQACHSHRGGQSQAQG
ncbi:hypothetical protein Y1Q_0010182 [Alligator mississippiensis]|uniref:Uncharacterized protein n=1 Tax=Alligator mississippiensis TaxID=8496 RepID=A0A151NGG8_ALLMI|nr:hypothetical protein Y1Q_0010182 [Alligator mississippiensis]